MNKTIIIKNPSDKLLAIIRLMKINKIKHRRKIREQIKKTYDN